MPKASTPSFVLELPLQVSSSDERLLARGVFEAGKRLNNALLQEGLACIERIRQDSDWATARGMPRKTEQQRKARAEAFRAVRRKHGFSDYDFQALAVACKNAAGFAGRLATHLAQKLGTKVYKALDAHLLGLRGRPRFKGKRRPLHSLEGKNNAAGLRWDRDKACIYLAADWAIPVMLPNLGRDEWLWSGLAAPTKFCRILWRMVRGQRRWFVQLVQQGLAPLKASLAAKLLEPREPLAGLDIGPSTIGWCTETDAGLFTFCAEVDAPQALIRRLQRKLDRQCRANNPDNFKADGTVKRGRRVWVRSKEQVRTETQLRSVQTHAAEYRANAHGRDINALLARAQAFRHDGVNVESLQRNYGRSVGARAPGRFMSELHRKAERAGGASTSVNVRQLKTSQYDHSTGEFLKKGLSQRWHVFGDGRGRVQRDVYSAFLALHAKVADDEVAWTHDRAVLEAKWRELEPVLRTRGLFKDNDSCVGETRACIPLGARSRQSEVAKQGPSGALPGGWPVERLASEVW